MNELTRESRQGQGSRWRNTLLGGLAALAMVALGAAVIRAGGAAPTREEAALTRQGAARAVFAQQFAAYGRPELAPRQPLALCAACILSCHDANLGQAECEESCLLPCALE